MNMEFWRMRKQWIPGSSFRPHKEPGYEARVGLARLDLGYAYKAIELGLGARARGCNFTC